MSTPSTTSIDRATYLTFAKQWARTRWCWDDDPVIEEVVDSEYASGGDLTRPDLLIDQEAEDSDLDDPTEDWGIFSDAEHRGRIERLRARITSWWQLQAKP